jgi:uncharacterized membrane protein
VETQRIESLKTFVWIAYALLAASYFIPFAGIASVILAYIKRADAEGTYLHFHFTWLINTFWVLLALSVVGVALLFIVVGWAVLFGAAVWALYRIIKGGLRLNEARSPYDF